MLNSKTLMLGVAIGVTIIGLGMSSSRQHFSTRWNASLNDLHNTEAPIPHAALHNRALEIMQERADAVKAAAAADDRCGTPADFIGPVLCPSDAPVVAESVPLPRPDPRKVAAQ